MARPAEASDLMAGNGRPALSAAGVGKPAFGAVARPAPPKIGGTPLGIARTAGKSASPKESGLASRVAGRSTAPSPS